MSRKPRLQDTASAAPATVTKVSKGEVAKLTPKRRARRRVKATPLVVVKANPAVMREALRIAGGDRSRLRVVDARTVDVLNQSRRAG